MYRTKSLLASRTSKFVYDLRINETKSVFFHWPRSDCRNITKPYIPPADGFRAFNMRFKSPSQYVCTYTRGEIIE